MDRKTLAAYDQEAASFAKTARRFSGEVRRRTSAPGVATGLAYTTVGGDVLFIEAAAYPGKRIAHPREVATAVVQIASLPPDVATPV